MVGTRPGLRGKINIVVIELGDPIPAEDLYHENSDQG